MPDADAVLAHAGAVDAALPVVIDGDTVHAHATVESAIEAIDQISVALGVLSLQVVEQTTPAADEHEETAARMVIFGVRLEMLGEVADALTENRDLYFR